MKATQETGAHASGNSWKHTLAAAAEKYCRRTVSFTLCYLAFIASVGLLPVWLPVLAAVDAVRRSRWALCRFGLFMTMYFINETFNMTLGHLAWVVNGGPFGRSNEWYKRVHYTLQRWWSGMTMWSAWAFYGVSFKVEGAMNSDLGRGPLIMFIRHTSIADTFLPPHILANRYGYRIRYVMKRGLLWDPCIDIGGNRIPNCFIDRESDTPEREIKKITALMDDLDPMGAVLIYPEGTRFSEKKKKRVLDKARAAGDAELVAQCEDLKHVLPPRKGGPMALLDRNQDCDVLFIAHSGFECANHIQDMAGGSLLGVTIRAKIWRVAKSDIPENAEERYQWLYKNWQMIDAWLDDVKNGQAPDRTTRIRARDRVLEL